MADQWTQEELEALVLSRARPTIVQPRTPVFMPTLRLRWYRPPMSPDTDRVLQQLYVDLFGSGEEWRDIEVFLED